MRGDQMKKSRLLNRYRNNICGFAFDFYDPELTNYGIQTYLVTNKNNKYKFHNYERFENIYPTHHLKQIELLLNMGYLPLKDWTNKIAYENTIIVKTKKKNK